MSANSSRRFWTVPNILSLSRLALLPVFFWLMSRPDRRYWIGGGVLIVYGMVSDILDGMLARKLHQVTEAGKIIDPLADKVTAGAVAIFCVIQRGLPVWAFAITVVRDLALVVGGQSLWKKKGNIPTSLMIGKLAALAWGVNLLFWVFDWQPLADYTLWPAVAFYAFAGLIYFWRVIKAPR
jgi:cardiolipin synthase